LPSDDPNEPFLINAIFFDSNGAEMCEVIDNEWIAHSDQWDIESKGNSIKIREAKRKIVFHMELNPPNGINIEKLIMNYHSMEISVIKNTFGFKTNGISANIGMQNLSVEGNGSTSNALNFHSNGNFYLGTIKLEGFYNGKILLKGTHGTVIHV
jgi:hypothetical protein